MAPWDPATVLLGCVAVGVTAMAFVWWPAHRAAPTNRFDVLKEG